YAPGTYAVVASAANGNGTGVCTKDTSVTISEPIAVTLAVATTNVSCNGSANGTITANGSAGTTITVNGAAYNASATYAPGTYAVVASAANGNGTGVCTKDTSVTISEPIAVTLAVATTNVSCNGSANGTITANGSAGATITVKSAAYNARATYHPGTYAVVASGANGNGTGVCTKYTSGTISEPIAVTLAVATTNVS